MSNTIKVYRVVDDMGYGMYRNPHREYSLWDDCCNGDASDIVHPIPTKILVDDRFNSSYHFAFMSVDQMISWIYEFEWIQRMHCKGARVFVIEVPAEFVIEDGDGTQCAFSMDNAVLVEDLSIIQFIFNCADI